MSSLCLMLIKSSWLNSSSELAFLTNRNKRKPQSLKQPLSFRATEGGMIGEQYYDVPSMPQSILLGLQITDTTKEKKTKKTPKLPKIVRVK